MNDLGVQVSEHQERVNFIEEFKTVQARDSVCSGRLSHVAISPTRILNLGVMPSRVQSMRQEERHHQGVSGDVINDPFASVNNVSTFLEEFLILKKKIATYGDPVQPTWKPIV